MVRIDGKAVWLFVPALTDVLIRGKPSQRFESFGKVISHQERVELLFQVLMGLIVVFLDRGFSARSIHALRLAIRPGMISFGRPMGDGVLLTYAGKDGFAGIFILLPIRKLDAVIGEYGVKFVQNNRDKIAQELCRHSLDRFSVQPGRGELRGAVNGDKHVSLAFCGAYLSNIEVEVADRRGLERFLLRCVALDCWQAADGMPLQTAVKCGSRQVGNRRLQGVQAIIQGEQRMPAKRHHQRLFFLRQHRGMRLFRPHRRIVDIRPCLPFRDRLGIEVIPCGQFR